MIITDFFNGVLSQVVAGAVGSIVGIVIENRFHLINKLKKIMFYVLNSPIQIQITFSLNTSKTAKEIGKIVSENWKKKDLPITIILDSENDYSLTNNTYNIQINQIEEEIVFQTSNMDTTIRRLREKFSEVWSLIENNNDIILNSVSVKASLPYRFDFVEIKTTSNIEVENYDIQLKNDKWKSQLILQLKNKKQNIEINGKNISEMYEILNKIFSPI